MAAGLPEDITFLKSSNRYQDEEGAWHEGEVERRTVVCQSVIYGALTRAQLRSSDARLQNTNESPYVGFVTMATVELWTVDYEGEDRAIFRGEEVQVEIETMTGAKTQLILRRRLGNDQSNVYAPPESPASSVPTPSISRGGQDG